MESTRSTHRDNTQAQSSPPSNFHPQSYEDGFIENSSSRRSSAERFLAQHASEGQNFTFRATAVGLLVGAIIAASNMYFGLQTGWVSSMSMPSSLIGFAFFKTFAKHLDLPFTPVENVLVQTVAGSVGTMPLGCGFVGVLPALRHMLKPDEGGPIDLSLWKLILWSLGLCFFGVVFAVPLRKQVIIREKLKFPSGTATALMIGVLHGKTTTVDKPNPSTTSEESFSDYEHDQHVGFEASNKTRSEWKARTRLLLLSFAVSGFYTLATYFFPILRDLPVFGTHLAEIYLWTLNPSFAYIGQGIIMGPATTTHMLLGAIVGWGILSPLAKHRRWAPGPVKDWETGSKGWIVWISLAIMLADSVISLAYIVLPPLFKLGGGYLSEAWINISRGEWQALFWSFSNGIGKGYRPVHEDEVSTPLEATGSRMSSLDTTNLPEADAPPEHLVNNTTVWTGLVLSIIFCVVTIHIVFGPLIPLYATILAILMALILSIMGVRALGETDLNPVSGISKLAQLFFALVIPQSNKNSVLINLVAGAVSEAGALQAGDLMQDLKTGHLLGAAPNAQFWGQIIGSAVGAVVSSFIYIAYTRVYEIPGDLFQVPTGYVWISTARLVTGEGLPYMAWQWSLGAAIIFSGTTAIKIVGAKKAWQPYIPGGIAVAVGMYNVPSFTLARAVGGFINWYWKVYRKQEETPIIILASGLILGEGVVSIVNLILASTGAPHL